MIVRIEYFIDEPYPAKRTVKTPAMCCRIYSNGRLMLMLGTSEDEIKLGYVTGVITNVTSYMSYEENDTEVENNS
jgi:hypothetical protein